MTAPSGHRAARPKAGSAVLAPAQPAPKGRRPGGRATRREDVLAAALTLFAEKGFDATSVRDIAERCGMLSGSLYYHFPSKEELYVVLHDAAVESLTAQVEGALDGVVEPWARLERAVGVHLEAILKRDEQALLVMTPLGRGLDGVRARVIARRDAYESLFRGIVDAIDLDASIDRSMFRLHLIGALNWAHTWYRPGRLAPRDVAARMMDIARRCRP